MGGGSSLKRMFLEQKKTRIILFWFIAVILLFFVSNRIFFFSPVVMETISSYIVYPVLLAQRFVVEPYKKRLAEQKTVCALKERMLQLTVEKEELLAEHIKLQSSLAFVRDSNELVEYQKRFDLHNAYLAHILLKHLADDAHYILIDGGQNKGIAVDMVAVYKNNLIGRVTHVYPYYSKVLLATDRTCKVAAVCVHTNVHGIHEGLNTTESSFLNHVSHLVQLQEQDLVISSGEGLVFPQGFALGSITKAEPNGMYYNVTVKPLYNVHCIDYCLILMGR